MYLDQAIAAMKSVFRDIPYGIDHTTRVLNNAEIIMTGEGGSGVLRETVALAAVLHDIGAVEAQKKHGSLEGRFQELEGPAIARSILEDIGVPAETTERVCFIVGHHHTPDAIDGSDFQILWEADYLEMLQLGGEIKDRTELRRKVEENFRTASGRSLAFERLDLTP